MITTLGSWANRCATGLPDSPRYVALNTLNKVVSINTAAVQRHRNIILDCLRDGDISIRRRALELSYALIDENNVRVLTRELLAFLEVADNEFKLGITTQISLAAERFAPNKRWHIDTVLRVLKLVCYFVISNLHPLIDALGWQLRARRDSLVFYSSCLPYTGVAGLYRVAIIRSPSVRRITGMSYSCRSMDHRRIQRNSPGRRDC